MQTDSQPRVLQDSLERDRAGTELPSRILAAIDIGTNSIHMVVVQIQPSLPTFNIITTEKATVRLGERCQKTGRLTPEAMERSLAALRRCQELARGLNAEQIIAVATSAVREAPNGRDFIREVEAEIGLKISLISGQEEARRIYLGVLSGMEFNNQPHVLIDIGGGSTELILGDGHEPRCLSSTKVGAVRLTEEFITTDPITSREFERLRAYVQGLLEWPIDEVRSHLQADEAPRLIGTSGTIESLIYIHACQTLGACPTSLHGYELSLEDLQALTNQLRKLDYTQRCHMPGMSERRAEIIVAGAVILLEAMSLLAIKSIIACERALREGMIVDWMLTHGLIEDRLRYQSSVRQRNAISMAQKYRVNLENGERVAAFAISLFDQTQEILHNWGTDERDLLWAAAILHNCGHYVSHSAHHKHSYYLIRQGNLLGYTDAEIEIIANLARYHRRSCPKKKHENYQNLASKTHRQIVTQLSAILRLAVALDRRRIGAIQAVRCEYNPEAKELNLHLQAAQAGDDCGLELWSLDYKKDCFESEFGVKLLARLEDRSQLAALFDQSLQG
jgi:exopolyphosphatase/guanosine-5'-triphosphate,3'-diphosphate pyrophosphatase